MFNKDDGPLWLVVIGEIMELKEIGNPADTTTKTYLAEEDHVFSVTATPETHSYVRRLLEMRE